MATSAFTVYTLGETTSIKSMLESMALIFQDPLYSSDSAFGLGYGVLLGALILMLTFIYQSAVKKSFDMRMLLMPLFAYVVLTGPKVDMQVVDVYNIDQPQQAGNVPVGLALALNIASGAAYIITKEFEQGYSTPNSPRILTDGFVSPLKSLNALRSINLNAQNPHLSQLVRETYKSCIVGSTTFSMDEYLNAPDAYVYFSNYVRTQAQGVVPYTAIDGSQSVLSCSDAADQISKALHAFMYGDGSGGIDSLIFNFKNILNQEINNMSKGGGNLRPLEVNDFLDDFALITERGTDEGRTFMINALFNPLFQNASYCSSKGAEKMEDQANQCTAWIQANEQMTEDNAAAASSFMMVMQDGQNIFIIIAIFVFPIIVLAIMFMGLKSMMAVTGYLIYIASVYLWLPMASVVNFVVISRLKNTVHTFAGREDSSLFGISDYGAFYDAISNSLMLANGLIAAIPILCSFVFIGMTAFAVALQNRWNQGRSKYADTTLDSPAVLSGSGLISQKSSYKSNGLAGMAQTDGGKAWETSYTSKDAVSVMQSMNLSEQRSIMEAKRLAISHQLSEVISSTSSGSNNNEVKTKVNSKYELNLIEGGGFLIVKGDSNVGSYGSNGSIDAKIAVNKDGEIVAISGMDAAQLKARIGIGNLMSNSMGSLGDFITPTGETNANGSGVNIPQHQGKVVKGLEGSLNLRFFKVDLGATVKSHLGVSNTDIESRNRSENQERIHLQNTGTTSESASRYVFKLIEDTSSRQMIDGKEHTISNSTAVSESYQLSNTLSRQAQLERMLSETDNEIKSINYQLEKTLSSTWSSNLLAEDVLNRIASHTSVLNDLEALNRKNLERYGEAWESAKQRAEATLNRTTIGVHGKVDEREYAAMVSYAAAFLMNAEATNAAHKIVTGVDVLTLHNIESVADKYDWKNWKDIGAEADKLLAEANKRFGQRLNVQDANHILILDPKTKEGYFAQPEKHEYTPNSAVGQVQNNYTPHGVASGNNIIQGGALKVVGSATEQNAARVYNAFLSAGFNPRQARILTVEVGRENSLRNDGMYGLHYDPHKKELLNGGLISFNDVRKRNLDRFMEQRGLMIAGSSKNGTGKYAENQASLNAMAQFIRHEMEHGKNKRWSTAWRVLNDDRMTDSQMHGAVGREYILWRYTDSAYSSGMKNIRAFRQIVDNVLAKQGKIPKGKSEYIENLGRAAFVASGPMPKPSQKVAQVSNTIKEANLGRMKLQKPNKPSFTIPAELRLENNDLWTKADIKKFVDENKEIIEKKGYEKIEKEYGLKVVKGEKGELEAKIKEPTKFYMELAKEVPLSRADRVGEMVLENPAVGLANAKEALTGVRTGLGAEMDVVSNKNPTIFSHPNTNQYMKKPTRQELGLPDDIQTPQKTIHGFGVSKEVEQAKIDDWMRSEVQKNEVYKKQNDSLVDSILSSAGDKEQRRERPKPIEQMAQQATPENRAALNEAVKRANDRNNSDAAKWAGLGEQ